MTEALFVAGQYLLGGLLALLVLAMVAGTVRVAVRRRRQLWVLPDRTVQLLERKEGR